MTTREEWEALAQRCREATGPDREIDIDLAQSAFPNIGVYVERCRGDGPLFWEDPFRKQPCPKFTASLDAIVALIEKTLPGWWWSSSSGRPDLGGVDEMSRALIGRPREGFSQSERAATPALALCAAFCMAMAARKSGKEGE